MQQLFVLQFIQSLNKNQKQKEEDKKERKDKEHAKEWINTHGHPDCH